MFIFSIPLCLLTVAATEARPAVGAVFFMQSSTISASGTMPGLGHFSSVTRNSDGSLTAHFDNGSQFTAIPGGGGWDIIMGAVAEWLRREASSNQ